MDLLILTFLGWIYQTTADSELCGMCSVMIKLVHVCCMVNNVVS